MQKMFEGIPVLGSWQDADELPPVMWITDELMDRATWVTDRHLPGKPIESPFTKVGNEPWVTITKVVTGIPPATYVNWVVDVRPPLLKGETRPRRATYLLEGPRREEVALSQIRWVD